MTIHDRLADAKQRLAKARSEYNVSYDAYCRAVWDAERRMTHTQAMIETKPLFDVSENHRMNVLRLGIEVDYIESVNRERHLHACKSHQEPAA